MNTRPQNSRKPWSPRDMQVLKDDIRHHTPARMIAMHLKRTVDAVYAKASELHLSLKSGARMAHSTMRTRW